VSKLHKKPLAPQYHRPARLHHALTFLLAGSEWTARSREVGGFSIRHAGKVLYLAIAFVTLGWSAHAAHKDVKHCADDYRKFCHQWGLETKGLENCMRKHGDHLTNACIAALVKAGEVTQAEVDRRKKNLGR
jgi:hypothetical protein